MARDANKAGLRQLIAIVLEDYVRYRRSQGFQKIIARKTLESDIDLLSSNFSDLNFSVEATIWKQAFRIVLRWRTTKTFSSKQMIGLINLAEKILKKPL